jgi:hypothetical protein
MKKRENQAESSVKLALKIKAFEKTESMIKVPDANHVRLTDEKTGQFEDFEYDKIFDIRDTNSDLYDWLKGSTVGRVFDNTNCCIICIGQNGGGKSYSLYGNDARLDLNSLKTDYSANNSKHIGIVQRVFQGLVEASMDFQDNKEFQILFSMLEVHKDSVRDLLAGFEETGKNKEARQSLENLEVYESANGQLMIKNLSSHQVDSEDFLIHLLAFGLRVRTNNHRALGYGQPQAASHVVMNMNFVLRDKENYNFPSLNATVQFVEVACPERLPATLNDQKKFLDCLSFNSQLQALQKVLSGISTNKKMLPYKDSKLTKVMQNYCNVNSEIVVINHCISNPREFIACLSYMITVARFRSDKKEKMQADEINRVAGEHKGDHITNSLTAAEEKVVKKMKEDLRELDARFEYMKKEYRNNFIEIGNIIGAKENLEGLIYKKMSGFWTEFREKKATLAKIESKDKQLNDKDLLIIKTQRKIEDLKRELADKLELHIVQCYQSQDEINYLRDQIKILHNNRQEFERDTVSHRYDKIKQLASHNQMLLQDKAQMIGKFPKELLKVNELPKGTTADSIRTQTLNTQKQKNEEIAKKLKEQNLVLIEIKKKELESALKVKNEEAAEFEKKCLEKKSRKKQMEKELENELTNLYQFILKQSKVIYKVRNDAYNSGLDTVNIPTEDLDQLHLPTRETHQNLFRVLDKKKVNETRQLSKEGNKDETLNSALEDVKSNLNRTIQKVIVELIRLST